MALFMGLTPCKGQVNFDDINITTANEKASVAAVLEAPGAEIKKSY